LTRNEIYLETQWRDADLDGYALQNQNGLFNIKQTNTKLHWTNKSLHQMKKNTNMYKK